MYAGNIGSTTILSTGYGASTIEVGGNVNIDGDPTDSSINQLTLVMKGGSESTPSQLTIKEDLFFGLTSAIKTTGYYVSELDSSSPPVMRPTLKTYSGYVPNDTTYFLRNFKIELPGFVKTNSNLVIGGNWSAPGRQGDNKLHFLPGSDADPHSVQFVGPGFETTEIGVNRTHSTYHAISGDNDWYDFIARTYNVSLYGGIFTIDTTTGLPIPNDGIWLSGAGAMEIRFSNDNGTLLPDRQVFRHLLEIHGYGSNYTDGGGERAHNNDLPSSSNRFIKIGRLTGPDKTRGPYEPTGSDRSIPTPPSVPQSASKAFWYMVTSENCDVTRFDYVDVYYCFSDLSIAAAGHTNSSPYKRASWPNPSENWTAIGERSFYCIKIKNEKFFFYSFTEDSDGNGKIDRFRIQAGTPTNGDLSDFSIEITDKSKNPNVVYKVLRYEMVKDQTQIQDDSDSVYAFVEEQSYPDTGATPVVYPRNNSLRDSSPEAQNIGGDYEIPSVDTAPPRIAYTLCIPDEDPKEQQIYFKMSEPISRGILSMRPLPPGWTFKWIATTPYIDEFLIELDPAYPDYPYTADELAKGITFPVSFLEGVPDNAILQYAQPANIDLVDYETRPKYPSNYEFNFGADAFGTVVFDNMHSFYLYCDEDGRFHKDDASPPNPHRPPIPPDSIQLPFPRSYKTSTSYDDSTADRASSLNRDGDPMGPVPGWDYTQGPTGPAADPSLQPDTWFQSNDRGIELPNEFRSKTPSHRVSDVLIMVRPKTPGDPRESQVSIWPLYARDGGGAEMWPEGTTDKKPGIAQNFDGKEQLQHTDIIVDTVKMGTVTLATPPDLIYSSDIKDEYRAKAADTNISLWLPDPRPTLPLSAASNLTPKPLPLGNVGQATVESSSVSSSGNSNYIYRMSKDDNKILPDKPLEFIYSIPTDPNPPYSDVAKYGPLFGVRLAEEGDADVPAAYKFEDDWYKGLRPFKLNAKTIIYQRSGATILNNVINPLKGEKAVLNYRLTKAGRVTIHVLTLDGTIVKTLFRESREAGEYSAVWDGKNGGGRPVARGMYFVRIVAPDIDEIRKVMVVK